MTTRAGFGRLGAARARRGALAAAGFVLFALLAVANSAGYRFGVSDQSFYLPAVDRALDPARFPHDAALIDAQARLTAADDILAAAERLAGPLGLDRPGLVGLLYVAGLLLLYVAARSFGRSIYGSEAAWTTAALAAALTVRHGISRAGVNTLEGYFHPRLIVFAAGVLAAAWFLRGRTWPALALVGVAGALHPTTALWFAAWIGIAAIAADGRSRAALVALAAATAVAAAWAVAAGPLAGRLARMDAAWLAPLAGKDYLFPDRWPAYAWVANLAYVAIAAAGFMWVSRLHRDRRDAASGRERGLAIGALALAAIFLASLPFNYLRVALVIQLQIARVFWMLDFFATALVIGWLARSRGAVVTAALVLASAARGAYIMTVQFPDRPLVRVSLPRDAWHDAMAWASRTPPDTHWLAHPGHVYLYGTSVRVAAGRDVLQEEVKDAALAMYSRGIALRVADRAAALADFDAVDGPRIRALASRYDLDYLVTEMRGLPLPVAYQNVKFTVYQLSPMSESRVQNPGFRIQNPGEDARVIPTDRSTRPPSGFLNTPDLPASAKAAAARRSFSVGGKVGPTLHCLPE